MHINRVKIISIFVVGAHLSMYSMMPVKVANKTAWNTGISVEPSVMNSQNIIIPESKDVPLVIGSESTHEFIVDSAQYSDLYRNYETSKLIEYIEKKHADSKMSFDKKTIESKSRAHLTDMVAYFQEPQRAKYNMQPVKNLTQKIKAICKERNLDQNVWFEDVANDKQALMMRLIRLNNMSKPSDYLSILKLRLPCAESDALLCYYKDKNKIKWNVVDAASHTDDIAMQNRPEVYISKINDAGRFKLSIQPQADEKLLVDIEEVENNALCQSKNPSSLAYLDYAANYNVKNIKDKNINCEDIIAVTQIVDSVALLERMLAERDMLQQKLANVTDVAHLIDEKNNLEKEFTNSSTSLMRKRDIAMLVANLDKQIRTPVMEKNELDAALKSVNKQLDTFIETY